MTESDAWRQSKSESWSALRKTALRHWKLFLYLTLLMTGMNLASHGTQDMYPTFLQRYHGYGPASRSLITALSMVAALAGGVSVGLLSDHLGRRRALASSLFLAILAIPLWAYSSQAVPMIAGACLIQFMVQGAWGVIPAHLSELSPSSIRGFLPGFAYQCGALLAGTGVYIEAVLAKHVSFASAMAITACSVFVLAIVVILLGPEKKGARFDSEVLS